MVKNPIKTKKSQIAIFIILGVVILLGIGLLYYVRGKVIKKEIIGDVKEAQDLNEMADSVKTYLVSCLNDVASNAVDLMGKQSGYIYTNNWGLYDSDNGLTYNPAITVTIPFPIFSADTSLDEDYKLKLLRSSNNIDSYRLRYIFYADTEGFFSRQQLPSLVRGNNDYSFDYILKLYVSNRFNELCANTLTSQDFSANKGFTIKQNSEPKVSVNLAGGEDLSFNLNYSISIEDDKTNSKLNIDKFNSVNYRVPVGNIYSFLTDYTSKINSDWSNTQNALPSIGEYYLSVKTDTRYSPLLIKESINDYGIFVNITDSDSNIKDNYLQFWFMMFHPQLIRLSQLINEKVKLGGAFNIYNYNLPSYIQAVCLAGSDETSISSKLIPQQFNQPIAQNAKTNLQSKNLFFITKKAAKHKILEVDQNTVAIQYIQNSFGDSCAISGGASCIDYFLSFSFKINDDKSSIGPFPFVCYSAENGKVSIKGNVENGKIKFSDSNGYPFVYNFNSNDVDVNDKIKFDSNKLRNKDYDYFIEGMDIFIGQDTKDKIKTLEFSYEDTGNPYLNIDIGDNFLQWLFDRNNEVDIKIIVPTINCPALFYNLARKAEKKDVTKGCVITPNSDEVGLSNACSVSGKIEKQDGSQPLFSESFSGCTGSTYTIPDFDTVNDKIVGCNYQTEEIKFIGGSPQQINPTCNNGVAEYDIP